MERTGENLAELGEAVSEVLARCPEIAAGYLFGSVARGEARADSDLDIGLVYRDEPSRELHPRIAPILAADLGRATGFDRVDLLDLEAQGPIFRHRVLCDGRRVYEADSARRIDFESETVSRALDFRPTYNLATRGKAAALRRWLRKRHDLRTNSVPTRRPQGQPGKTG